ncbi:MAG: hypothetical protein JXI43_01285 [Tissierellales bacterium]|nr:hypothetical protein [Tissierellales bacterium]
MYYIRCANKWLNGGIAKSAFALPAIRLSVIKNKMEYLYTVWFKNKLLDPNDQDHEWPACIIIEAEDSKKATEWGDFLAKKYSNKIGTESYIHSSIEILNLEKDTELSSTPRIKYGYEATDNEIGW